MAFLDEDDALPPDDRGPSGPHRPPGQRPFLARRLLALALGVAFIVLIVLGLRACVDARKERGFENYVRDLTAIATESQQLSEAFFQRLGDPGDLDELSFQAEISADRSAAEDLLQRVEGLSTPDELSDAQSELELAFQLRRDAIAGIADQISTALGNEPGDAFSRITGLMRYFLASDVLYRRSRETIVATLEEEEITPQETLPEANFLPDDSWLDETEVRTTLAGAATGGGDVAPGLHGLALLETQIAGTTLTPDVANSVSGGEPFQLEVAAQNQGENDEAGVPVEYSLSGGAETIEGTGTIGRIAQGATRSTRIEIEPAPETGTELTLEVTVGPVPGEELVENNTSTYTVTFE